MTTRDELSLDQLAARAGRGDVDAAELAGLALGLGPDQLAAVQAEADQARQRRDRRRAEDRQLLRWLGAPWK